MDDFGRLNRERDQRIRDHAALRASRPFQEQATFLNRLVSDYLRGIHVSWVAATRNRFNSDNSLVLRRADDLLESGVAIHSLVKVGMHNPARREKRFVLEALTKYLAADESNPKALFDERLAFFEEQLDREGVSAVAKRLELSMLDPARAEELRSEIRSDYARLCSYVHPSMPQLRERIASAEQGVYLGFDTVEQFRRVNRELSRFFDICLSLFFHAVGPMEIGDLFVHGLDDFPKWKFHRTKFTRMISERVRQRA